MAKIEWEFSIFPGIGNFTDKVLSASYITGRQSQYDNYTPGGLSITIDNSDNFVNDFELGALIDLEYQSGFVTYFLQYFWVTNIDYLDAGNTGQGSTAVVTCTDVLGRLGRTQVFEQVITSEQTLTQLVNEFGSLMPGFGTMIATSAGNSTAAPVASFSGTVLDRINLNIATEQGMLKLTGEDLYLYARSDIDNSFSALIFDRTTSGINQVGYTNLQRSGLGANYVNAFTVTPTTVAAQNAINTAGQSTYGIFTAELASVDDSQAQALALAQWMTFSRDDPTDLSFTITFDDLGNNILGFLTSITNNAFRITVKYKAPGSGVTKSLIQILQGFTMEMTPQETIFTAFTSPLTFYNYFTLDSTTLGVLDTSRLAW